MFLKRKIQKKYAAKVTLISKEYLHVKSTDKDTTHLNKDALRDLIQMDTELKVVVC